MPDVLPVQEAGEVSPTPEDKNSNRFLIGALSVIMLFGIVIVGFWGYQKLISPQTKALSEINNIIKLVETPDQNIVSRYGISQDQLKSNTQQILNGAPDKNIPGLKTVKKSIEQGDLSLAHKQLVDVFTNWLWGRTMVTDDSILLSNEEKVQADPENRYFGLKPRVVPRFSAVRKEVNLRVLKFLYLLNDNTNR